MLWPSNPVAGPVLLKFDHATLAASHDAIGLGSILDIFDVLLIGLQPRFPTPIELAGGDALVDSGLLILLTLVGARRAGKR